MEGKIPPHNTEAEQSTLGALMLESETWDVVADQVDESDFYKPAHQKIFAAIKDLQRRGQPTDLITVSNYLMEKNLLELVGGPAYLAQIIDQTPSTSNVASYAKIVSEKSLVRKMIQVTDKISDQGFRQDFEDVESYMDQAESAIFGVAEERSVSGLTDSATLVKETYSFLEEIYHKKGSVNGVPSGFMGLDDMTAGFQPGEIIILAARPSMGKTAFSLNIAMHAALNEKKAVAYFSAEMAKEQVMVRMLSIDSKVPLSNLRVGQVDDKGWQELINSAARLSEAPIFIDDTSGISPFELRAKARRMKAAHGLDMIMIDYLQLMRMKQKMDSREREVSEISSTLKAIAKELKVPVIALAQLNRGVEGRTDRRPMLSDLRESGSIEQDADVIMMLYREDYYERDNPEIKGLAECIIGKQRNGPTGTVKLRWVPEYGIFKDDIQSSLGPEPPPPSGPPQGYDPGPSAPPMEPLQASGVSEVSGLKNFAPEG